MEIADSAIPLEGSAVGPSAEPGTQGSSLGSAVGDLSPSAADTPAPATVSSEVFPSVGEPAVATIQSQRPNYAIVRLDPTDDVLKLVQLLITNGFSQFSFVHGGEQMRGAAAVDDPLLLNMIGGTNGFGGGKLAVDSDDVNDAIKKEEDIIDETENEDIMSTAMLVIKEEPEESEEGLKQVAGGHLNQGNVMTPESGLTKIELSKEEDEEEIGVDIMDDTIPIPQHSPPPRQQSILTVADIITSSKNAQSSGSHSPSSASNTTNTDLSSFTSDSEVLFGGSGGNNTDTNSSSSVSRRDSNDSSGGTTSLCSGSSRFLTTTGGSETCCSLPICTAAPSESNSMISSTTASAPSVVQHRGHPLLPITTTMTTQQPSSYLSSLLQQQQQQQQHQNNSSYAHHFQNTLESHTNFQNQAALHGGIDLLLSPNKNGNEHGGSSSSLAAATAAAAAAAQLSRDSTVTTPPAFTTSRGIPSLMSSSGGARSGILHHPVGAMPHGSGAAGLLFSGDLKSATAAVPRIPTLAPNPVSLMHPSFMSKLNGTGGCGGSSDLLLGAAAIAATGGVGRHPPAVLPHHGSSSAAHQAVAAAQRAAAYQHQVQQLARLPQQPQLQQHITRHKRHHGETPQHAGYPGSGNGYPASRRRESAVPYTTPATTQLRQRGSRAQSDDPSVFVACRLCQNKIMASRLSNLTNHVRRHSTMKQFQCCYCDYTHNEMAKVRLHMLHNHKDKDSQPIDNLSPEMQASWDVLMQQCFPQHYQGNKNGPNGQTHPDVAKNVAKNLSLTVGRLSCGLAANGGINGSNSSSAATTRKNSRLSGSSLMMCNGCGREIRERDRLEHVHRMHLSCSPYVCSLCGFENGQQQKVMLHIAIKHSINAHGTVAGTEGARVLTRDTLTIAEALMPKYFGVGSRNSLPASPSAAGSTATLGGGTTSPIHHHNPASRLSLPVISSFPSSILSSAAEQPPNLSLPPPPMTRSPMTEAKQNPQGLLAINHSHESNSGVGVGVRVGSKPKFTCKVCSDTIECAGDGTVLIQLLTHAKQHQQKLQDPSSVTKSIIDGGIVEELGDSGDKVEGEWIDWLIPCFPTIAATFLAKKHSDELHHHHHQQPHDRKQTGNDGGRSGGGGGSISSSSDGRMSALTSPVSSSSSSSPMETDLKEEGANNNNNNNNNKYYSCTICDFVTPNVDQHQLHFWKHKADQVAGDQQGSSRSTSAESTAAHHVINGPKIISTTV